MHKALGSIPSSHKLCAPTYNPRAACRNKRIIQGHLSYIVSEDSLSYTRPCLPQLPTPNLFFLIQGACLPSRHRVGNRKCKNESIRFLPCLGSQTIENNKPVIYNRITANHKRQVQWVVGMACLAPTEKALKNRLRITRRLPGREKIRGRFQTWKFSIWSGIRAVASEWVVLLLWGEGEHSIRK